DDPVDEAPSEQRMQVLRHGGLHPRAESRGHDHGGEVAHAVRLPVVLLEFAVGSAKPEAALAGGIWRPLVAGGKPISPDGRRTRRDARIRTWDRGTKTRSAAERATGSRHALSAGGVRARKGWGARIRPWDRGTKTRSAAERATGVRHTPSAAGVGAR